MNVVCLLGRLGNEPEVRYTQAGKAVASFSLAVSRGKEGVDFIPCVAWEKTAETVGNYLAKGSQIAVNGRLQARSYDDKNGNKRTAYEVVVGMVHFCGKKEEGQKDSRYEQMGAVMPEEEIPF